MLEKLKKIVGIAFMASIFGLIGCANPVQDNQNPPDNGTDNSEDVTINLWAFTDEVPGMLDKFIETHPDIKININKIIEKNTDKYQQDLDNALKNRTSDVPDIYCIESDFVSKYTKGSMSNYAMPYADLGIDINNAINEAEIANYVVDIGKNSNGNVVGLAYQSTSGCFIYRRSVAKQVFGTDDPAVIQQSIGGGTGNWDTFWDAAKKCASKNVAIVSGEDNIWRVVESSAENGWIVDGKLNIDPKRKEFLEFSKNLYENNWTNNTLEWTDGWYEDMRGAGQKPVLGIFGPSWLIYYTIKANAPETAGDWAVCNSPVGFSWGGTWLLANQNMSATKKAAVKAIIEWITLDTSETGLQYQWANGLYNGTKDTVASSKIMKKVNGEEAFLGGQNMFDYFVSANESAKADTKTEYDAEINNYWMNVASLYKEGKLSLNSAIKQFEKNVFDKLRLVSNDEPVDTITLSKYIVGNGPEDYYYNYSGKADKFISDLSDKELKNYFVVEISGKASKTFEVPLILCFREVTGNTNNILLKRGKITKCNAGENFTVSFAYDLPSASEMGSIDISTVYFDLCYDMPFFDDELTISDLSFKQIKEDNLDTKVVAYNYHVGSNVHTDYYISNSDYYLPITSGHEDFFLSYWFGDNWNYKLTGWYDNPNFTGEPITKINAADNTKNRDYYAKYDLIIRRGEWEDNGETKHNYNASVSFKDLGITKVPAPGSVLTLKLKGRASCALDGTFDADVIDVSNNGWNWLCRAASLVNIEKDTEFTKYFAIKLLDNIPQVSLDDYSLNLLFNFKDISKEQEFYISDYEFTVAPETELVKYTYHSIGKERVLYGVKGEEYLLPEEEQNKEYFNWDLNSWAFDSVYWYENPECSGERVSKIAAEDNTKDRDFYASQRLIIRRNEWEDNGIKKHDYGMNPYLYETGITNISVPFSTLGLQISGKPSCDFNGRVEARIIDTSKGEWKWLNNVPFTLNVKKGEQFAKNVVFNVQENECPSSLNNLVFEIKFYFDDASKEQEFAIDDFKLTKLPESEFVTYTYYIGANEQKKYVVKGSDFILPTEDTWWDYFKRGFTTQHFLGWYENPDFTGDSITLISAEDNTTDKKFYGKWALKLDYTYWEGDEFYSNMTRFQEILPEITTVPTAGKTYKLHFTGTVPKEGDFSFALTNIVINGDNEKWEHFNNGWFSQHVAQGAYDFTIDVLIPEGAKFDSLYSTGLKVSFYVTDKTYNQAPFIISDYKVEVLK